jgi:hypothetical protein
MFVLISASTLHYIGLMGLNKVTDAITNLRLSETWDDFNEARMDKKVTPANIILRGIISDFRVTGYIDLVMGVIDVVFFGICLLQGCITLKIVTPLTDKHMVDTILWTGILFGVSFTHRVMQLLGALETKKRISLLKRQLTIFPRDTVDGLLDLLHDTEFYSGPHEGLLLLSPEFIPVIHPNRQISFELSRIDDELDRLMKLNKAELRALCETAHEKKLIDCSRYALEAILHFVIGFCALLGYPFNYYYAAASFRYFGDFSVKLIDGTEIVRCSALIVDAVVAYFVVEPAVAAVQTYREKKAKMM